MIIGKKERKATTKSFSDIQLEHWLNSNAIYGAKSSADLPLYGISGVSKILNGIPKGNTAILTARRSGKKSVYDHLVDEEFSRKFFSDDSAIVFNIHHQPAISQVEELLVKRVKLRNEYLFNTKKLNNNKWIYCVPETVGLKPVFNKDKDCIQPVSYSMLNRINTTEDTTPL